MGSVPNADHDLLCSLNENSLICLYRSAETPFTTAFPTAPGDTTSMILIYLHVVLGLFQKALSMVEERSSPLRALVIAPPERKECIEKSAFSPATHAWLIRAWVISAADMGTLPRMGAPPSVSREMLGNKYPRVISKSMTDPLEIKEKPTEIREPKDALYERAAELVCALSGLESYRKQGQVPCKHYASIRIGSRFQACSQRGHDGV